MYACVCIRAGSAALFPPAFRDHSMCPISAAPHGGKRVRQHHHLLEIIPERLGWSLLLHSISLLLFWRRPLISSIGRRRVRRPCSGSYGPEKQCDRRGELRHSELRRPLVKPGSTLRRKTTARRGVVNDAAAADVLRLLFCNELEW